MVRLLTVHEFMEACDRLCLVRKERCTRYNSARDYLSYLELRFEHRKDFLACDRQRRSGVSRF
ncbi:MAG: hypothetical protein ACOYEP_12310 [Limnochordia bacterium]|jgi:hypothetical protein